MIVLMIGGGCRICASYWSLGSLAISLRSRCEEIYWSLRSLAVSVKCKCEEIQGLKPPSCRQFIVEAAHETSKVSPLKVYWAASSCTSPPIHALDLQSCSCVLIADTLSQKSCNDLQSAFFFLGNTRSFAFNAFR